MRNKPCVVSLLTELTKGIMRERRLLAQISQTLGQFALLTFRPTSNLSEALPCGERSDENTKQIMFLFAKYNEVLNLLETYEGKIAFTDTTLRRITSFHPFLFTVDSDPPVITVCPNDITQTVLTGEQGGIVNFPEPVAIDNSGIVFVSNDPQFYSGFYFPLGTTTVTYVFSDNVPLTSVCSFTVTINTGW